MLESKPVEPRIPVAVIVIDGEENTPSEGRFISSSVIFICRRCDPCKKCIPACVVFCGRDRGLTIRALVIGVGVEGGEGVHCRD